MKRLAALAMIFCGAANAAVFAVAKEGQNRIELHDEAGPCLGSARLAVYTDGKQKVPGCWTAGPGAISIAFLDGDFVKVPMQAFQKPDDA